MRRKDLVTRNTEEVVVYEELDEILEQDHASAYVGYETSGPVHLGHWMSARKLLDVEEVGIEPTVLLADEHTLMNNKADFLDQREDQEEWVDQMTDYWQTTFEGLGLEHADFVRGSDFQNEKEYFRDLREMSQNVNVNRAKHALGDVASDSSESLAQLNYPLMQSLDIAHLDVDLSIGGTDQRKIHMLAREELPELGYEAPTSMHYPLLTSLEGGGVKMSSSEPSTMFPLHAAEETIRDRINDAYCTPDADNLFEENPLLQISEYFIFGADEEMLIERPDKYGGDVTYETQERLEKDFESGELHPQDLKHGVADYVADRLEPVREEFKDNPEILSPLETAGYDLPDYVE